MLRLAADEDFNNDILRGLVRQNPSLDIVRLQDVADYPAQTIQQCWSGPLPNSGYSSPTTYRR